MWRGWGEHLGSPVKGGECARDPRNTGIPKGDRELHVTPSIILVKPLCQVSFEGVSKDPESLKLDLHVNLDL